MGRKSLTIQYDEQPSLSECSAALRSLMDEAIVARSNAYAPYSKFSVGAALRLEDGTIVHGNNQENAAYPSGLCAERVAVFHTGAVHPDAIITDMAITASDAADTLTTPVPPCGACRQSLLEYEQRQGSPIQLHLMGASGPVVTFHSVADTLPWGFDSQYLPR